MYPSEILIKAKQGDKEALKGCANVGELCEKCNGFAEVFPEHKYEIVAILQDCDHVVGMTGENSSLDLCPPTFLVFGAIATSH